MDSQREAPRGTVTASVVHALKLAACLSPEHAREVRETTGLAPAETLLLSLASSQAAYACMASDRPVFMMGVEASGRLTRSAMVWMLGSDDMAVHAARVLRTARWGVEHAFQVTGAVELEQYIPEWYGTGLRFAARLGFTLVAAGIRTASGTRLVRVRRLRGTHPEERITWEP